jgi:hypothetical protein
MQALLVPTRRLFKQAVTQGTISIGGLVFLFTSALGRRPSNPHQMTQGGTTLEPRRQGLRFLEISQTGRRWPLSQSAHFYWLLVDLRDIAQS